MAMLASGEYSLNKKNVVQERKSMLFVKLTDSAQRALNEYLRNLDLNSKDLLPQIEFNKSEGRILIPSLKANANSDKCMAQFKFDVTSNMAMQGAQGRFDCVQHKRNTKQLFKFGQLTQRLRIHANEDVYETTKNRMAAIELEQRKNCTRQLDWNSTTGAGHMNRKSKLEKMGLSASCGTALTPPSLSSIVKCEEKDVKPVPAGAPADACNVFRSKTRSVYNPPQKLNANACKMRKPLRERLVQMLAVKPYKRNELLNALKQEGLRECDKPHFPETLNSISTLRDNVHYLAKSAWQEVQEDWLFYSEQEKQIVQKNKLRNLTSPSSSDSGISTSSNQSPSNTSGEKSPPSSYKRPGYINGVDGFMTKRPRISHYVRPEPAISSTKTSSTPSYDENNAQRGFDDFLSKPSPSAEKPPLARNSSQLRSSSSAFSVWTASSNEVRNHPQRKETSPPVVSSTTEGGDSSPTNDNGVEDDFINEANSTPVSSSSSTSAASIVASSTTPQSPPVSHERSSSSSPFLQFLKRESSAPQFAPDSQNAVTQQLSQRNMREKPKYMKEYVTITNTEQRRKYKADFTEIFKEYKRVHEEIDAVSNQFAQLGELLRQQKKGSPKYQRIENEIFKKYYALKCSEKFHAAKRRFEYLHEKLSHIKDLVHDYDQRNNDINNHH